MVFKRGRKNPQRCRGATHETGNSSSDARTVEAAHGTGPSSSGEPSVDTWYGADPSSSMTPAVDTSPGTGPSSSGAPLVVTSYGAGPSSSLTPAVDTSHGTGPSSFGAPWVDTSYGAGPSSLVTPAVDSSHGTAPSSSGAPWVDTSYYAGPSSSMTPAVDTSHGTVPSFLGASAVATSYGTGPPSSGAPVVGTSSPLPMNAILTLGSTSNGSETATEAMCHDCPVDDPLTDECVDPFQVEASSKSNDVFMRKTPLSRFCKPPVGTNLCEAQIKSSGANQPIPRPRSLVSGEESKRLRPARNRRAIGTSSAMKYFHRKKALQRRDAAKSAKENVEPRKTRPSRKVRPHVDPDEETPSDFLFPTIAGALDNFRIPKTVTTSEAIGSRSADVLEKEATCPESPLNPRHCHNDSTLADHQATPTTAARETPTSIGIDTSAYALDEVSPSVVAATPPSCALEPRGLVSRSDEEMHDSGVSSDEEPDENDEHCGEDVARPDATSVRWKPLSNFQLGSLHFVKQRNKRRKLSSSVSKRNKRECSKSRYVDHRSDICDAKKRRYERSPQFVQRLVARVSKYQLYASSRRYAADVKHRASQSVKYKYLRSSPFRRSSQANSLANRAKRRRTAVGCMALRQQNKASYKNRSQGILARRKLLYRGTVAAEHSSRDSFVLDSMPRSAKKSIMKSPQWFLKRKYMQQRRSMSVKLPRLKKDSAEYRAMSFRLWKRHRNYSMLAETGLKFGPCQDERLAYLQKKSDVSAKLDQTLKVQRELRAQLDEKCKKMCTLWTEADGAIGDLNAERKVEYLREYYGGEQFHVRSCQSDAAEQSNITYKPYAEVFSSDAEDVSAHKASLKVWACDESCDSDIQPLDWPSVLHEKLKLINSNLRIQPLLKNIAMLENCVGCTTQCYCSSASFCSDTIRFLLRLRPHFAGLRTLIRDVYRMRRIAFKLHVVELLLLRGTFHDLCSFCEDYNFRREPDVNTQWEESNFACDEDLRERYGKLISACELAIQESMRIHPCFNCLRLTDRKSMTVISPRDNMYDIPQIRSARHRYKQIYSPDMQAHVQICRACHTGFKNGKQSDFSFENDMWPDKIPDELACLNPYELQSIARAKCCQRILKLYPYRYKGPTGTLTRAVKGMSLHLPLPTGTVNQITSILEQKDVTLPDLSSFLVHVDSLPKLDKDVIYRSIYDHQLAKTALHWLQTNNPLYHNITIRGSGVELPHVRFSNDLKEDALEIVDAAELEPALDENATNSKVKLLPSKRRNRVDPVSYFDMLHQARTEDDTTEEGTEADDCPVSSCEDLLPGGAAAADIVTSMKYKISYAVPYKRFLLSELRNRSSMYMHLPEADVLEQYSVVDMNQSLPKKGDLETFASKPLLANPLKMTDPHIDVACFPDLFPYGTGGIFHNRTRIVPVAYYIEHRFRMTDPRFRRSVPYLFDCALRKDEMALNSSLFTMLSRKAVGSVTAGTIKKAVKKAEEHCQLERSISTLMRLIGGTPQFWQRVRLDLEAFIEHYGKPTFFLTFSCAEYNQPDYRIFLEQRNADLDNVQCTSIRNLVAIDPVSVAEHFEQRFWAFFNTVLMADDGPLGKVEHYFVRKEYQQRGAPHMHLFLWIKDAPVHGKDSVDDVQQFIAKHISCTLPDPIGSPLLHELVSKYQMHKCTKSCLRSKTVKGKYYSSYCRYGLPRRVSQSFQLNTLEDVLRAKAGGQGRIKLYSLPRKPDEIMVNDYNPVLLKCWGSNLDIQYITDDAGCLSHYVTKYITKTEQQNPSALAQTVNRELSQGGQLKSLACKLLSCRQLSTYEAADKVLRHPLYSLSTEVKAAGFYYPGTEKRRLKPLKDIAGLNDDSTDIFTNNFQDKFYPQRPKKIEALTAIEVLQQYEYRYGTPVRDKSMFMPQFGVYFSKRTVECVVRVWKTFGEGKEHLEQYAFQILALFRPWRKYAELLTGPDGTVYASYTDAYISMRDTLPDLQRHESYRNRLTKMIEWADGIEQQVQREFEHERVQGADVLQIDPVLEIDLELTAQSKEIRSSLSQEIVNDACGRLNEDQKEAFDLITGSSDGAPKRLFVSGVGGTGKSFLINTLRLYFEFHHSKDSGPAVLVAAPTGVAAANVDGVTIHRLLKLPVSKGNETGQLFFNLHPADAKVLRTLFKNVKLLIIDEVSMLSNLYLLFVHKRLNEILIDENRNPGARFGNLSILLLGDLLQLPPVKAPNVFEAITKDQVRKSFRSLGCCFKLWDLFDFVELRVNMRQKDDSLFTALLERVRVGSPVDDDFVQLKSRVIVSEEVAAKGWDEIAESATERYLEMLQVNNTCLCILPLNEAVSDFNTLVMKKLGLGIVISKAVDVADVGMVKSKKTKKPSAVTKKKLSSAALTGGLEENLMLAVGARVMLRRNIDVKLKLINGTIGIIESIDTDLETGAPAVVYVRFTDIDGLVPVKKVKSKYYVSGSLYVERCQFPLTLAYAITVHKCQGLSLQSAMIDLGRRTFSRGMAYVALSRVVKLENVHLIRFDPSKIVCDSSCAEEYNRLRRLTGQCSDVIECNKNPEIGHSEPLVEYPLAEMESMLRNDTELRQLSHPRKVPASLRATAVRKPPPPIRLALPAGEYLKFSNCDAHSCFANAALQCLLQCDNLYTALRSNVRRHHLASKLCDYFDLQQTGEAEPVSANDIRSAFDARSQYSVSSAQDCDTAEFLLDILNSLPADAAELFGHLKQLGGNCRNATCGQYNEVQARSNQLMEYGFTVEPDNYSFAEVFKTTTTVAHRCIFCLEMHGNFPVTAQYDFPVSCRYLVLNNPVMFGGNGTLDKPLTGLVERNLTIFGLKWRLVACVQMCSSGPRIGGKRSFEYMERKIQRHYLAYVRRDGREWARLDDTSQRLMRSRPRLVNMVLLFFEKC